MAFVRSSSPRYFAPATFKVLDADGNLVTSKFDCEFKRHKLSELKKLQAEVGEWGAEVIKRLTDRAKAIEAAAKEGKGTEEANAEPDPAVAVQDMVNRRLLERVMTGWRGVQEPDKSEAVFSLTKVDAIEEEFPGFINACARSFWNSTEPTEAAHLAAKN